MRSEAGYAKKLSIGNGTQRNFPSLAWLSELPTLMHTIRAASLLLTELASANDRRKRIHLAAITVSDFVLDPSKWVELKPQQQGVYFETTRWNLPGPLPSAVVDRHSAGLLSPLIGPLCPLVPSLIRTSASCCRPVTATSVIAWKQDPTKSDVRRLVRVHAVSILGTFDRSRETSSFSAVPHLPAMSLWVTSCWGASTRPGKGRIDFPRRAHACLAKLFMIAYIDPLLKVKKSSLRSPTF
jgi:hypothetical protein